MILLTTTHFTNQSDYYAFYKLKSRLCGKKFNNEDDLKIIIKTIMEHFENKH